MENVFKRGERNTYSIEEKLRHGEFVAKFKEEYDAEVKRNEGKTKYDAKRKSHTDQAVNWLCCRSFYTDLVDASNDDPQFEGQLSLHHVHITTWSVCETLLLVLQEGQEELALGVK